MSADTSITVTPFTVMHEGVPLLHKGVPLEIAYNTPDQSYYLRQLEYWQKLGESGIKLRLRHAGLDGQRQKGQNVSDVEAMLVHIQDHHAVDFAFPLAGYPVGPIAVNKLRVLVTRATLPPTGTPGDWPHIHTYLESLLGARPLQHHMAWWKWARKSLFGTERLPGQVMIYVGPRNAGKSYLQTLTTRILGAADANPFPYLSGSTPFNADLFKATHLMVEDALADWGRGNRRKLGAKLKELVVNHTHHCHGKGQEAINLPPKWRVTLSLNPEQENLAMLPPLDDSITDKLMLFSCGEGRFPVDFSEEDAWPKWSAIVDGEMPAFLHAIDNFAIPDCIKAPRFGVKSWLDPELVAHDAESSVESVFWSIIQHDLPVVLESATEWTGAATDLERLLSDRTMPSHAQADRILNWPGACGTYLGRLSKLRPANVVRWKKVKGQQVWRIIPD